MSHFEALVALLGGSGVIGKPLERDADLERLVASGLPAAAVSHLAKSTHAPLRELQNVTSIDRSTFSRRAGQHALLKPDESDRVARVARIAALAIEALGRDEGIAWLRRSNAALGDRVPMQMLGTDAGVRQVEQVIGRIEHGVFS